MLNIYDYRSKLMEIIIPISKLIHMEIAIFDESAKIVCTTPVYKKIKGTSVHVPSINEVLEKGNVLVTSPGKMESCFGCRFVENCPSKLEILTSIHVDSVTPAVISITSFDKDDAAIMKNIKYYIETLDLISGLIEKFLVNVVSEKENEIIMYSGLGNSSDNYMITNTEGRVLFNGLDQNKFNVNCAPDNNLSFWLDPEIVSTINKSRTVLTINATVINEEMKVSSIPIMKKNKVLGYKLFFSNKGPDYPANGRNEALESLISVSESMSELKNTITRISKSSSSVVIYGETGTGKELIAKSIHQLSPRKNEPFIALNCANIPEQLFESELFGYEDGTFTGAKKGGKHGILEQANGGTVFLDEISELPLFQQAKLLRFLQERTVTRLGGTYPYPVDVRIICATNKDLQEAIEKGTFRKDLYYRINVIKLKVPSLRERRDDIPYLAEHFINLYKGSINSRVVGISKDAKKDLLSYDWPGNVRELENCIECALNIEPTEFIDSPSLPLEKTSAIMSSPESVLKVSEAKIINDFLNQYGWSKNGKEKTAETLNISVRSLYRKIKEYELKDNTVILT